MASKIEDRTALYESTFFGPHGEVLDKPIPSLDSLVFRDVHLKTYYTIPKLKFQDETLSAPVVWQFLKNVHDYRTIDRIDELLEQIIAFGLHLLEDNEGNMFYEKYIKYIEDASIDTTSQIDPNYLIQKSLHFESKQSLEEDEKTRENLRHSIDKHIRLVGNNSQTFKKCFKLDLGTHPAFNNDDKFRKLKVYLGAWCISHLRNLAKDQDMNAFFEKELPELFAECYGYYFNASKLVPKMSDDLYKKMHQIAKRNNNALAVIIRSVIAVKELKESPHNATLDFTNNILVKVFHEYSLDSLHWFLKAQSALKVLKFSELVEALKVENYTDDSCDDIICFHVLYRISRDNFLKPPAEKRYFWTEHFDSHYYHIARLLSPRYFTVLGRERNKNLIAACICIFEAFGDCRSDINRDSAAYRFGQRVSEELIKMADKKQLELKTSAELKKLNLASIGQVQVKLKTELVPSSSALS